MVWKLCERVDSEGTSSSFWTFWGDDDLRTCWWSQVRAAGDSLIKVKSCMSQAHTHSCLAKHLPAAPRHLVCALPPCTYLVSLVLSLRPTIALCHGHGRSPMPCLNHWHQSWLPTPPLPSPSLHSPLVCQYLLPAFKPVPPTKSNLASQPSPCFCSPLVCPPAPMPVHLPLPCTSSRRSVSTSACQTHRFQVPSALLLPHLFRPSRSSLPLASVVHTHASGLHPYYRHPDSIPSLKDPQLSRCHWTWRRTGLWFSSHQLNIEDSRISTANPSEILRVIPLPVQRTVQCFWVDYL